MHRISCKLKNKAHGQTWSVAMRFQDVGQYARSESRSNLNIKLDSGTAVCCVGLGGSLSATTVITSCPFLFSGEKTQRTNPHSVVSCYFFERSYLALQISLLAYFGIDLALVCLCILLSMKYNDNLRIDDKMNYDRCVVVRPLGLDQNLDLVIIKKKKTKKWKSHSRCYRTRAVQGIAGRQNGLVIGAPHSMPPASGQQPVGMSTNVAIAILGFLFFTRKVCEGNTMKMFIFVTERKVPIRAPELLRPLDGATALPVEAFATAVHQSARHELFEQSA